MRKQIDIIKTLDVFTAGWLFYRSIAGYMADRNKMVDISFIPGRELEVS